MSEKWIEIIEEPETITKINHEILSWTTCSDDQCGIYRLFKKNVKWYPKKGKDIWEKAKYIKQILSNKNTGYGVNDNQDWEIRNTSVDYTKHGKHDIDIIRKPNQKYLDNDCIRIGEKNNSICHNRNKN